VASKQKILSVSGLLSGAMVWGLMWYPNIQNGNPLKITLPIDI
jgi:hypothetical protein